MEENEENRIKSHLKMKFAHYSEEKLRKEIKEIIGKRLELFKKLFSKLKE